MYKLAEDTLIEELHEAEVQWHLAMIRFNAKDSRKSLQKQPPLKIEQKAKNPAAVQQIPITTSPTSKSLIGKGKKEIS